jgi:hypothetical protein
MGKEQLGFDDLLRQAVDANNKREFNRDSAHLPGEIEAAIRYHRTQIKAFHAAVQAADLDTADKIRDEAHMMAVKVNHGEAGILADRDSPGYVIARRCAAKAGKVPLFGQEGRFRIGVGGVTVLIAMDGMFGLGGPLPGFAAHAVDFDPPFFSETGYRSFLQLQNVPPEPGLTTAEYVTIAIANHIASMKGKLVPILPQYRPKETK